jgi:SAM-dependent MidA family methyltransferase
VTEGASQAIRDAIRDHGPITVAEFMEHALYGPGGFYMAAPVGPDGDFVTSPHVHPVFGELLGRAVRHLWEALGRPDPLRVTEVGAGDGTLARQLLDALADVPSIYTAVELGASAREELTQIAGIVVEDALRSDSHVLVANELLDNLQFRVVRKDREVRIDLDGDRLAAVEVDIDDALRSHLPGPPTGGDRVVPVGAFAFVDRLAQALRPSGYGVLIDYGDAGPSGEVHGYRGHRVVADVLAAPGDTDITAGVDFEAVSARARAAGLQVFPLISQHDALMALGLERWLRDELSRQHEELEDREGAAAVRTWSGRSRATLLADPGGLGRFRWLVLATPGLPAPAWLEERGRVSRRSPR